MTDNIRIGYEVSFTQYFYKLQQLRTLTEISADIQRTKEESQGLLDEILNVNGFSVVPKGPPP